MIITRLNRFLLSFYQNTRATVFIEFAFMVPILLMLFIGSMEYWRYYYLNMRLERTVSNLADVITQYRSSELNETVLQNLIRLISVSNLEVNNPETGYLRVSSYSGICSPVLGGTPESRLDWTRTNHGGLANCNTASFPSGLTGSVVLAPSVPGSVPGTPIHQGPITIMAKGMVTPKSMLFCHSDTGSGQVDDNYIFVELTAKYTTLFGAAGIGNILGTDGSVLIQKYAFFKPRYSGLANPSGLVDPCQ